MGLAGLCLGCQLQFGHGADAVEDPTIAAAVPKPVPALQFGHGADAVEDRLQAGREA